MLPPAPRRRPRVVTVNRYPPGEVARVLLLVLGFVLGAYVMWRIQEVVFLFFVAILLATAIEPLVDFLRRGPFTRGGGVLVVYTAVVLVIAGAAYVIVPTVAGEASAFMQAAPDRLQVLHDQAASLGQPLSGPLLSLIDEARAALEAPQPPAPDQLVTVGATAAHTVIGFVTIFVLAFYWLVERASIKRVLLRSVSPVRAHHVNQVWLEIEDTLGGWVRGQFLLMLAVGTLAGLGFVVLGLPSALLLAVAASLFEILPMVGPILAFAPAVLVALSIDPTKALLVVAYAVVVEQIEANVLLPHVMGHSVGISPLTVLLGILVGLALYGVPGGFLAVPVAGAAQVILAHIFRSDEEVQSGAAA